MKRMLVISDDQATVSRLTETLGAEIADVVAWSLREVIANGGARIREPLRGRHPDTVVFGPDAVSSEAFELAAAIEMHWPATAVLVVADADTATLRAAMRAGIRDVLDPAESVTAWAETIAVAREAAQLQAKGRVGPPGVVEERPSQVIVVLSSKGGSGKTSIATNLAVGLAGDGQHSTVIVDLDLEFGDVSNALQLTPDRWIPDLVFGPAASDTMVLKSFLTEHEATGLVAACAPDRPEDAAGITAEHIGHLIRQLENEYRTVVVDTPPGLSEHTLAALEEATDVVYVCGLDVPSLRGLRKQIGILTELRLRGRREHLVLNDVDTRAGLSLADVERTLGREPDIIVPSHRSLRLATNEGVPVLQSTRRGRVVRALRALVERVRTKAGTLEMPEAP